MCIYHALYFKYFKIDQLNFKLFTFKDIKHNSSHLIYWNSRKSLIFYVQSGLFSEVLHTLIGYCGGLNQWLNLMLCLKFCIKVKSVSMIFSLLRTLC